jgi:Lon protease-like protein
MSPREIGLFPLGAVLVPGELMPLHIFEDRYKRLIGDCEQHGREFALLYADDDGARELGCTAELVEVTERFDDGRLNIIVRGAEGVRVVEVTRGSAYMPGRVAPAPDDADAGDEAGAAVDLYRKVAEMTGNEPDEAVSTDDPLVSYAIAARVEFPAVEKLRILEPRAERDRLMVIIELLARALDNIAITAEVKERAQTNGKVSHPRTGERAGGKGTPPGHLTHAANVNWTPTRTSIGARHAAHSASAGTSRSVPVAGSPTASCATCRAWKTTRMSHALVSMSTSCISRPNRSDQWVALSEPSTYDIPGYARA